MGNSSIYSTPPILHGKNKTTGFTLLELIVVCALIGIMLTISVPSLRGAFFTNPLKSTARQVIGIVNEVRHKAVRNQQAYHLYLSQLENRIWYEKIGIDDDSLQEDAFDAPPVYELQFPASISLSKVWIQSSGVISEDKTSFWISKKGYMEQAAILLSDEQDNSLSVQLAPFTDPIAITEDFPPN
ncbi:MAG: prepilin-type N-terminal cleavage/methylation domain-containing protein [Desulforhopalus sp.]|jgi:prepilin-type N-terminal cleavage/methylation domain-containing protein